MGVAGFSSIPSCSSSSGSSFAVLIVVLALTLNGVTVCNGGKTSTFVRNVENTEDMPLNSDVFRVPDGYNAPQQVHITQGDLVGKAVIVSWVTVDEPGSSVVLYWSDGSHRKKEAKGKYETYKFYNYTSGFIHHCTVCNLEHDKKYYYEVGIGHTVRTFWFVTPPAVGPDTPYTFGLMGDLGQTYDSNTTLAHYERNPQNGKTVLFVGDLSMTEPQPQYSAFREASFGHAIFDIKNRTHAYYSWHRNQDGYAVEADRLWFYNRYWKQVDESPSS
ncbi:hypothetical protein SAY87_007348 [Trapa incisa]|uniref:acid phosphatase n=1 Tax=Trapa incisa TaxID=236973 RepID=A0AAN7K1N1_9MYRT|nr:hypothetical protein SAY87_007348 [Trapa incisa]